MNSSNTSILGSTNGSKSAQKRRRYFANKRARLDILNSVSAGNGRPKFSLRTMPKIEPPKRRIVSTASVVAVEIPQAAPSPAIPIIPNVISVNKTDSLEKVSAARRKAKAPAKPAKAKVAKKPAKAPAKKTIKKVKVKAPAKKVKLSAKEKKGLAAQPAAKLAKLAKSVNKAKAKAKKAPAKAKAPAKKVNKKK